jgi:hypothetical protein
MKVRQPQASAPSPDEIVDRLLDIAMKGEDPGAAARAIEAARRFGRGPTDDQLNAWLKRFEKAGRASYRSLLMAITTLEEADVLVDALLAAAAKEGIAPPADKPWLGGFDWAKVAEEYRWTFLEAAIDDAANACQVSIDDDASFVILGAYLEHVLPTLVPDPVDRLAWWLERARTVSESRSTDINFGEEAQSIAADWIHHVAANDDLRTLLRLAEILQRPVWGATPPIEKTLEHLYKRIRDALPPAQKRGRRRAVSKSS